MSAIPCPNRIVCPTTTTSANESDFPISNYTSEGPEQVQQFYSLVFPESWEKQGCLTLCVSEVNQNEADQCALAQAAQCNPPITCVDGTCTGGEEDDGSDDTTPDGDLPPPPIFYNAEQSCSINCPDGRIFTFTTPAGTFSARTQAAADARAEAYACRKATEQFICIGDLANFSACVDQAYNASVSLIVPPGATRSVTVDGGSLPPGISLSFTDSDFTLAGIPTAEGQYDFTIRVTDENGNFNTKEFSILVASIADVTLENGNFGQPYSQTLTVVGPTTPPIVWAIVAGTLPPGLSLDPDTGVISGTPTDEGAYTFTVSMTDQS